MAQLPNLLTLLRLVFAVWVWFVAHNPWAFLLLLGLSGLTDILDGWLARRLWRHHSDDPNFHWRLRRAQRVGTWLDPVCDKIFIISVLGALWWVYEPPLGVILLIGAREILQLPLAVGYLWLRRIGTKFSLDLHAAWPGKVATTLQFLAILAIVLLEPLQYGLALAAAVAGAGAVIYYTNRAVAPRHVRG